MIAEASWTFLLPVSYPSETNKIMSIFLSARPIRNQFRIANLSKKTNLSLLSIHMILLYPIDISLPPFPKLQKNTTTIFLLLLDVSYLLNRLDKFPNITYLHQNPAQTGRIRNYWFYNKIITCRSSYLSILAQSSTQTSPALTALIRILRNSLNNTQPKFTFYTQPAAQPKLDTPITNSKSSYYYYYPRIVPSSKIQLVCKSTTNPTINVP
jgi:hypothetical protein